MWRLDSTVVLSSSISAGTSRRTRWTLWQTRARIPLPLRDFINGDIRTVHFRNGRFVTVVGDGEYINYTALAGRNKVFGPGN